MGQDEHETDAKNRTLTNSASELTNPFEMVKKTCQSWEMLNYDVRARIYPQITILVRDEHETDAKNQTLTNSASELTNLLEMVKEKHVSLWNRPIMMFELGFRPKLLFWAKMSTKQTQKSDFNEFSF